MGKGGDLSRAFAEDGARKTHVGGQALIEGIMMRGRYNWAVAVREPDGGIYVEEHDLASGAEGNGWLYWPLVRGCRALVESLMLGYKALEIAALHAFGDEEGASRAAEEAVALEDHAEAEAVADVASAERPADAPAGSRQPGADGAGRFSWDRDFGRPEVMVDALGAQRVLEVVEGAPEPTAPEPAAPAASADSEDSFGKREMAVAMGLGLVLGVVLFIVAPAFLTNLIVGEYDQHTVLWNVVDGLLRVAVFVFYLWLIGRMEDIRRMFMYHGAEHKTIHCYEHELPLTPENARSFPRLHVRCGLPHHGDGHRHLRVHHLPRERAHRCVGRAGRRAEARARGGRAHPAHARHRRHLL